LNLNLKERPPALLPLSPSPQRNKLSLSYLRGDNGKVPVVGDGCD